MNSETASNTTLEGMKHGLFLKEHPELIELLHIKKIYTVADLARSKNKIRSMSKEQKAQITDALYESGCCYIAKNETFDFTYTNEPSDYSNFEEWHENRRKELRHFANLLMLGLGVRDVENCDNVIDNIIDLSDYGHHKLSYMRTNKETLAIGNWLENAHWEKIDKSTEKEDDV